MDYNYVANQLILMFMAGRPTTEGPDEREIEALVKEAHARVGVQEYFENYKAENQSEVNGNWLVTYPIALTTDSTTGYKQAPLPVNYLPLPKNRGVVRVTVSDAGFAKRPKQLKMIPLDSYEFMKGGTTLKFSGDYFYAVSAGKLFILPACDKTLPFSNVNVTLAVPNDATLNEAHVMLIISMVMPQMMQRFGRKADMNTDFNPNN